MGNYVKKYPENTLNWIDLSTSDVSAAKQFYTELFGWEAEDQPLPNGGSYTMLRMNGKSVAGLGSLPPDQLASGHAAYWSSYVSVSDADEMTVKAEEGGATVVMRPMDVMDQGRMAIINDPTGAYIGLWQAKDHIGAQLVNIPNTLVWNELVTRDVAGAKAFYSDLFDWSVHEDEANSYTMFKNGDRWAGGVIAMPDNMLPDAIPYWNIYILVADLTATVEKARSLGALILVEPTSMGEMGNFAVIRDPQGGVLTVAQMAYVDPMP